MPLGEYIARGRGLLLAAVLLALGSLLYLRCFWIPTGRSILRAGEQLAESERALRRARERALTLERLEREFAYLEPKRTEIGRRNPRGPVPPALLDAFAGQAQRSHVALAQLSILERSIVRQFYLSSTYEAVVYARSADLERFLWAAIRDSEPAVLSLENLNLGAPGPDGRRRASFKLSVIRWRS